MAGFTSMVISGGTVAGVFVATPFAGWLVPPLFAKQDVELWPKRQQ